MTHVSQIDLGLLDVSESNVRRRERAADLDGLASSMERHGQLQPIVVQRNGDKYDILIGQRRYLAAQQLNWEKITASVLPGRLDDMEAKVRSFAENVQRRDLEPRDKADVCVYLVAGLGSVRDVSDYVGVSETTIRKWLGYASVPDEIRQLVDDKMITRPLATRIANAVDDRETAVAIAKEIASRGPTKAERERILTAAEELPTQSLGRILERADELKNVIAVTFILPERWQQGLETAARELDQDPADIARDATIQWLRDRHY